MIGLSSPPKFYIGRSHSSENSGLQDYPPKTGRENMLYLSAQALASHGTPKVAYTTTTSWVQVLIQAFRSSLP